MATLYKGFSTVNRIKKFRVTDVDLVKQDLLNHFHTRKGERVMQPNFGSIIWGLIFEPIDSQTRQLIIDDVTRIVNYEPRLSLQNITIIEQEHGIQIELDLIFIPTNQTTSLNLQFDQNTNPY